MNETNGLGLGIAGVALVVGVLGDALLRPGPGLNLSLWLGTLLLAALWLARRFSVTLSGEGRWLALPALLLAAAFAWRAAPALQFLDMLALLLTMALLAGHTRSGQIRRAGLVDYALRVVLGGLQVGFGALFLVFEDITWKQLPRGRWSETAVAIGRGVLLALPLLLLFGALLMAADAGFEELVANYLKLDRLDFLERLFPIVFWTGLAAGFLRTLLLGKAPEMGALGPPPGMLSLGTIEVGTVLGTLNALFLAFVLVQFRYFFGGAEWVLVSDGLTYADYARRGFFELVTVAALVLPVLLLGHWLLRPDHAGVQRLFRVLAGALLALLYLMMASALHRMWLYQSAYGLTELRLYVTAFMVWLALVFQWFIATVLRARREQFVFGALVSGLAVLALLHALSPDALIARVNIGRVEAGQPLDSGYLVTLGADAVPVLVDALPALPVPERRLLAQQMLDRWDQVAPPDWRAWNWGQYRAWRALQEHRSALLEAAQLQDRGDEDAAE